MKNDFRTLEQKIRQIMMSEKEKNVTQPAELDDINENTFEVKYAERKKGPIKVNKFKKLEDAKEFLSTVRAAGSNGIISKDGKPVKEDVELDEMREPQGISRAADRLAREETQVDELKKSTLRSYIDKASYQARNKTSDADHNTKIAKSWGKTLAKGKFRSGKKLDRDDKEIAKRSQKFSLKQAKKAADKANKRYKGIARAADKLTREETQIDGLKKSTKKEACWTGYNQAGMKKKGDKVVPNCVPENYIDEKAVSQAQQKLMGMAYAYKKGELENASETVKKIASSMSMKELRDFAKTKHENLPNKKTNESVAKQYLKQSVSEGYLWREYEPGEYSNGEEKIFVDLIKKNGGKNISVEKPTRREPNLYIEFKGGNLSKMQKDLDRIDDGGTNLEEAVSPAQQAAIAISKKKLKKMNTEATDKDSISNKELKSVGKGKKDKIKINPKMENDKQIDNTSEEM